MQGKTKENLFVCIYDFYRSLPALPLLSSPSAWETPPFSLLLANTPYGKRPNTHMAKDKATPTREILQSGLFTLRCV